MRSVAIVGLGWLGLPLARYLKNLGWEVKGTKRTHDSVEQMRLLRLETYHLELTPDINADPDDLSALLSVDTLIINIPPSQYFFDLKHYVVGVQNLVNEALLHGVHHIIFISSTSVFPEISAHFDESIQPQPETDVGRALVEIENNLAQLQNIDCDVIRFAGLVGQDRHPIFSLADKQDLKCGRSPVNLVHLADCARAIQLLLETPGGYRLYHLSAPVHPPREAYYRLAAEKHRLNPPHFISAPEDPQRIIVANKICRELDFVYQYPDPNLMFSEK
ncbi:SDR family NAD(P)-dependent oxidoreductase [Aggregatibacter actinomycetemcomitans]|uniref:SDR family NAD(P)-dependent oxidoreductase n=1 Tax=Aggregatibacter actinomycetemcomitans TaxID=714 RepID=UPI00215A758D|nr:SDR family NAD(P)-dependent oxidoreductase [Aggregatibacter actinomycetemcomitans]